MIFERLRDDDYEQIVYCNDNRTGLRAIIAVHSTALGPAVGGCRMWAYNNDEEALTDALRLSKGMTYKSSIAGLNWGGGKAVIIGDSKKDKTKELLLRYAEFVERLNGTYVTAKDVGISSDDLRLMKNKTKFVMGMEGEKGSSGDPSPATAWGVYQGVKAAAKFALGATSLQGLTLASQGLGSVGYYLLEYLAKDGAKLIGTDVDPVVIERAKKKFDIQLVSPEEIYDVKCDIFSPNALGASINKNTIPRIKAKVIAGGANNQLAIPNQDGEELKRRGVLYAPDYAINSGGITNIYFETKEGGYNQGRAFDYIAGVGQTMTQIFERAKAENLPTHIVADRIAWERVEKARSTKRG